MFLAAFQDAAGGHKNRDTKGKRYGFHIHYQETRYCYQSLEQNMKHSLYLRTIK